MSSKLFRFAILTIRKKVHGKYFFERVERLKTVTFLSFIIPILFLNLQCIQIFGHSFTTDDSIYLLTLIKKAETELDLAKENYPTNITLSLDHSEEAARFVADTFYTDEDVANDDEFTERYNKEISAANSTSDALVIATLIDEALREYSDSIDLSFDITNMSNLLYILPLKNENHSINKNLLDETTVVKDFLNAGSEDNYSLLKDVKNIDRNEIKKIFSSNTTVNEYSDYQSALAIALEINKLFHIDLKSFDGINKQNIRDITKLEEDLTYFYSLLNNKASPADVMKIVHLEIQPTLQKVFSLKTIM
jgi:hypothetical protein